MKIGIRKPSIKRSIKARTTGKIKRKIKKATNPFYGKKGAGWVKNPKKAAYNKVYNKTSTSAASAVGGIGQLFKGIGLLYVGLFAGIVWIVKAIIGLFKPKKTTVEAHGQENTPNVPITSVLGPGKTAARSKEPISQANVTITTHVATPESLEAQRREKVEEIRKLDSASHLSENGLTPSEIMMLSYAEHYSTDSDSFPRFWLYDYAISDPKAVLDKLVQGGFISIASAEASLSRLTVKELQAELSRLGLPVSGKKAILIERLTSAVAPDDLERIARSRKYILTDLGKSELEANEYIPYLHKHKDFLVSIWDVNKYLRDHPGSQWRDCVWGELNNAALESEKGVFGTNYRSLAIAKESMVRFLISEKNYKQALAVAAECSYYRMSHDAIDHYLFRLKAHSRDSELQVHTVKDYSTGKYITITDHKPPRLDEEVTPAPYQEKMYREIKDGLGIDDNELQNLLVDTLKDFCKPSDVFSASEIADIILADLRGDGELISNICTEAEKRITAK